MCRAPADDAPVFWKILGDGEVFVSEQIVTWFTGGCFETKNAKRIQNVHPWKMILDVPDRKSARKSETFIRWRWYWMFRKGKGWKGPKNPSMELDIGCSEMKKRKNIQEVQSKGLKLDVLDRKSAKTSKKFNLRAWNWMFSTEKAWKSPRRPIRELDIGCTGKKKSKKVQNIQLQSLQLEVIGGFS